MGNERIETEREEKDKGKERRGRQGS